MAVGGNNGNGHIRNSKKKTVRNEMKEQEEKEQMYLLRRK
jgi:hypothetical protein